MVCHAQAEHTLGETACRRLGFPVLACHFLPVHRPHSVRKQHPGPREDGFLCSDKRSRSRAQACRRLPSGDISDRQAYCLCVLADDGHADPARVVCRLLQDEVQGLRVQPVLGREDLQAVYVVLRLEPSGQRRDHHQEPEHQHILQFIILLNLIANLIVE